MNIMSTTTNLRPANRGAKIDEMPTWFVEYLRERRRALITELKEVDKLLEELRRKP